MNVIFRRMLTTYPSEFKDVRLNDRDPIPLLANEFLDLDTDLSLVW